LLACEDRRLVGCVRASNSVAEVSGRRRGSEKRAPGGKGARGRGPSPSGFARDSEGAKASITGTMVAKPWSRGRPEPGARKGIAGAKVFARWKALQVVLGSSVHAGDLMAVLAAHMSPVHARASRGRGRGDRGVRGKASTHHDGKTTPVAMDHPQGYVQPAEANRTVVEQATPRLHWRASARCKRTNDARVLVRRSEMAEVGPTHRALRRPVSRKASRRRDAGQGALRTMC